MIEIALGGVIVALLGVLVWEKREHRKEQSQWINALIAKTPEQYRDLELTQKVKPIVAPKSSEPTLVPEGDMTDEEFKKQIEQEVG